MNSLPDLSTFQGRLEHCYNQFYDSIQNGTFAERFSFLQTFTGTDEALQSIFFQCLEECKNIWIRNYVHILSNPDNTQEFTDHFGPHINGQEEPLDISIINTQIQTKYTAYQSAKTSIPLIFKITLAKTFLDNISNRLHLPFKLSTLAVLIAKVAIPVLCGIAMYWKGISLLPLLCVVSILTFFSFQIFNHFIPSFIEKAQNQNRIAEKALKQLCQAMQPLATRHVHILMQAAQIAEPNARTPNYFRDLSSNERDLAIYAKVIQDTYNKVYVNPPSQPLSSRQVSLEVGKPLPPEILLKIFAYAANPEVARTCRDNRILMSYVAFNPYPQYLNASSQNTHPLRDSSLALRHLPDFSALLEVALNLEMRFQRHIDDEISRSCPTEFITTEFLQPSGNIPRAGKLIRSYTRRYGNLNFHILNPTETNTLFALFNLYRFLNSPSLPTYTNIRVWLRANISLDIDLHETFTSFHKGRNVNSPTSLPEVLNSHPEIIEIKIPSNLNLTRIPEQIGFFTNLEVLEIEPQILSIDENPHIFYLPNRLWSLPNLQSLIFKTGIDGKQTPIILTEEVLNLKSLKTLDLRGAYVIKRLIIKRRSNRTPQIFEKLREQGVTVTL